MLRGQLSVSFVMRVALGFFMIAAVAYATFVLEDTVKQESQKQTIVSVAEYAADKAIAVMQGTEVNQTSSQEFRLPLSRDSNNGQYSVKLEDKGGLVYVTVRSAKWPDMVARQPLFLNASYAEIDETPVYPPRMCLEVARNDTHYSVGVVC